MKKKIVLLIGLVFILCGCTAEVNLTITPERVDETVIINAYPNQYYTKEQLPTAFRKYIPAFGTNVIVDTEPDEKEVGVRYYTRTLEELGNGYKFKYNYNFSFKDYKNSYALKNGFKSINIQNDNVEKQVLISTDNGGLLYFNNHPSLLEVKVNITPTYEVLEHNADSVNNGVYSWNLKRESNNKGIYLLMSDEVKEDKEEETSKDKEEVKNNDTKKEPKYDSEFDKFVNEHPILVMICALLLFFIVIIIVLKMPKIKL